MHSHVLLLLTFFYWEEVNGSEVIQLSLFTLPKKWSKNFWGFVRCHWESSLVRKVASSCAILSTAKVAELQIWELWVNYFWFVCCESSLWLNKMSKWCPCSIVYCLCRWLSDCIQLFIEIGLDMDTVHCSVRRWLLVSEPRILWCLKIESPRSSICIYTSWSSSAFLEILCLVLETLCVLLIRLYKLNFFMASFSTLILKSYLLLSNTLWVWWLYGIHSKLHEITLT